MSHSELIVRERRGPVSFVLMNRAPVNVIDHPMIDAIHAGLREADRDPAVRAVVLGSAVERMFCGGMDLKMVHAGDALDLRRFLYRFYMDTMDIQYAMSKPTIAAINGPARGAGMTLAINCDVALAAEDVDLGYPEIDVGVIPAIHYAHLPRQISRNKAFELLFGGKPIEARAALELGLLNRVVPRAQLMSACEDMGRVFAEKSPVIMALGRRSFMRANDLDYRRNVENQIETLCNIFNTTDGREGLRAFVEKRKPRWDSGPVGV